MLRASVEDDPDGLAWGANIESCHEETVLIRLQIDSNLLITYTVANCILTIVNLFFSHDRLLFLFLTNCILLKHLNPLGGRDLLRLLGLGGITRVVVFALAVVSARVAIVVLPHVLGLFKSFLIMNSIIKAARLLRFEAIEIVELIFIHVDCDAVIVPASLLPLPGPEFGALSQVGNISRAEQQGHYG